MGNGKNKWGTMILMMMVILIVTACGNNGQLTDSSELAGDDSALGRESYKSWYVTSVFLGDSITEGLSYHDVLEEENVLAGAGKTAQFALENVDELVDRNPAHIYIQLGSDDLLWPTENPQHYSLTHYAQLIDRLQAELPNASITLLSVTPVTAEVEEAEPRYRNIPSYNKGLQELAAEAQVGYVDLSSLIAEHPDLYDADGIHFQAQFYPLLLEYLQETTDIQTSAK